MPDKFVFLHILNVVFQPPIMEYDQRKPTAHRAAKVKATYDVTCSLRRVPFHWGRFQPLNPRDPVPRTMGWEGENENWYRASVLFLFHTTMTVLRS